MNPDAVSDVAREMMRQHKLWGQQNHPDGTSSRGLDQDAAESAKQLCQEASSRGQLTWKHILNEEVQEAFAETDLVRLRAELIQVAAVAATWAEAIDRRPRTYVSQTNIYIHSARDGSATDPVASITLGPDQWLTCEVFYEVTEYAGATDTQR